MFKIMLDVTPNQDGSYLSSELCSYIAFQRGPLQVTGLPLTRNSVSSCGNRWRPSRFRVVSLTSSVIIWLTSSIIISPTSSIGFRVLSPTSSIRFRVTSPTSSIILANVWDNAHVVLRFSCWIWHDRDRHKTLNSSRLRRLKKMCRHPYQPYPSIYEVTSDARLSCL